MSSQKEAIVIHEDGSVIVNVARKRELEAIYSRANVVLENQTYCVETHRGLPKADVCTASVIFCNFAYLH